MMIRIVVVALLATLAAGPLMAQDNRREPSGGFAPNGREDSLRGMIQERFARQVQEQLGLTEDQAEKMRITAVTWFARRRNLEIQERRLRSALAVQMRPGVPADQDSVARLTDGLLELKIAQVQTYRDELKDMTYLTPIQRAQFFLLRDRLLKRIEEVREEPRGGAARRRLQR